MENTLAQVGIIKAMGATAGPLGGNLDLPLIATQDIGEYAADALLTLEFTGANTQELLRRARLTDMIEAAGIIGRAIGNPDLSYVQLPSSEVRAAFIGMGISEIWRI